MIFIERLSVVLKSVNYKCQMKSLLRSEMLNRSMMTLDEERRAQVAARKAHSLKAAQHIRDKQKIFGRNDNGK